MQVPSILRAPSESRRLPFRLLTILDLVGLGASFLIAYTLDPNNAAVGFSLNLAVVGFGVWIMAAQLRSLSTILTHSRNYVLLAPMLGAAVVMGMRSLTGDFVSFWIVFPFVTVWTGWMLVCRAIRQRLLPRIRILTFGSPEYIAELRVLPNVELRVVDSPPEDFANIDVVALDPIGFRGDEWSRWLMHADMAGVKLIAAPLVVETLTRQLPLEALHGRWAEYLLGGRNPYSSWKRAIDVIVTLAAAPLLLFGFALVALAVYLDDGGPVIFWQLRVGQRGRTFRMAKIRSMRIDSEATGASFASKDDPRITRVGKFIRRYRLDELPQFWNVLKGDMSIVGPRPEQLGFNDEYEKMFPLYTLRYNLRPGITGWAQVRQGYAADAADNYGKLRYDLYYIRHVSPWLDATIVVRTFVVLANGFGSR